MKEAVLSCIYERIGWLWFEYIGYYYATNVALEKMTQSYRGLVDFRNTHMYIYI